MILSWQEREERKQARADEFRAGEITEPVFRACLFALRYRGDDIEFAVRENRPR
jgi:hypothetical protein